MSETKRRDITLGEMQDECKKRSGLCSDGMPTQCQYSKICDSMLKRIETENGDYAHNEWRSPIDWNLTDPSRFTEAQMALLNGFMAIGAVSVQEVSGWFAAINKDGNQINLARALNLCGESIDLAELLGKENKNDDRKATD